MNITNVIIIAGTGFGFLVIGFFCGCRFANYVAVKCKIWATHIVVGRCGPQEIKVGDPVYMDDDGRLVPCSQGTASSGKESVDDMSRRIVRRVAADWHPGLDDLTPAQRQKLEGIIADELSK